MPPTFEPEAFGKYYLVDRIATGGMAEIFKAKSFSTAGFEKIQVIKRILSHLSDNDEFVSMFIDEAKISVSLQHANLVQIYDFGKIRDNYFIAMEWVDGKDVKLMLRKLAERRKLMPEEFAVLIAHEACKGLDYAHKKTDMQGNDLGIVHRDMSPSNVLVSYEGEVKIADFGIAKAEMSQYSTKDGVLKGKFEYMSPEQARGETDNQQSDLFSAAIILYEMLTGRRLFKTDSEIKTLEKIKKVDIKPPSSLNPNIPQRLDDIVMKALTVRTEDRYRDAREFQHALLEYMYPSTPPVIQRSLSVFMVELFADDKSAEIARLEAGSIIAIELYNRRPEMELNPEWEEGGHSGSGTFTTQEPPSKLPYVVAGLIILLLLGVIGALGVERLLRDPPPEPTVEFREVEVHATTGSVVFRVNVPAEVHIGEELVGQGDKVRIDDLEPGDITFRVSAEGYEDHEEVVEVEAGGKAVFTVVLREPARPGGGVTTPPPDKKDPPPPTNVPQVRFESSPPGAQVYLDNSLIGRTPMTWSKGSSGGSHSVSFRMDGYTATNFDISITEGLQTHSKALSEKAAAQGTVNINLRSKGWADIFIDGANVGRTPKFGVKLAAGQHTIRAVNEQLGLDETKTITVLADETSKVLF